MKALKEKRACQRCEYKVPVTCAFFSSDRFYRVITMNHCDDGIYFESNFSVKPGGVIYIRVKNGSHGGLRTGICHCGGIHTIGIAEVKWCKELTDVADSYYGIGLKYYPPPM